MASDTALEVIDLDTLTRVVRDEVERHEQHSRARTTQEASRG